MKPPWLCLLSAPIFLTIGFFLGHVGTRNDTVELPAEPVLYPANFTLDYGPEHNDTLPCSGHGYHVTNAPQPWCACDWGWRGTRCGWRSPRTEPRGAFVFLVMGAAHYFSRLPRTLSAMEKLWVPTNQNMDVLVFISPHLRDARDDKTGVSYMNQTIAATSLRVFFHDLFVDLPDSEYVRSIIPEHAAEDNHRMSINASCMGRTWHLGYLQMNRFFCVTLWQEPALRDYDMAIRVDTDMVPTAKYPCNFLKTLAASKAFIGHIHANSDEKQSCRMGLPDVAQAYAKKHNFAPARPLEWLFPPNITAFSGALTVFDLRVFLHPQVQQFFDFWDRSGYTYTSRSSDQVLWPVVMQLFFNESKVHQYGGFPLRSFDHRGEKIYTHSMIAQPGPYCMV